MYIARGRAAVDMPSRSLHPGPRPIDNRWNKKLEFVYSLVTQIRAAARHPRPTLPPFSDPRAPSVASPTAVSTSPTNTSQQRSLFRRRFSATTTETYISRHERRRAIWLRGTNTSARTPGALPPRSRSVTQAEDTYTYAVVVVTDTSSVRRRSFHFIFPHFSLRARRFAPSDEFAELLARPGPEYICQTVKQIGRQLTNTIASLVAAHSSAT